MSSIDQPIQEQTQNQLSTYITDMLVTHKRKPQEVIDILVQNGYTKENASSAVDTIQKQLHPEKKKSDSHGQLVGAAHPPPLTQTQDQLSTYIADMFVKYKRKPQEIIDILVQNGYTKENASSAVDIIQKQLHPAEKEKKSHDQLAGTTKEQTQNQLSTYITDMLVTNKRKPQEVIDILVQNGYTRENASSAVDAIQKQLHPAEKKNYSHDQSVGATHPPPLIQTQTQIQTQAEVQVQNQLSSYIINLLVTQKRKPEEVIDALIQQGYTRENALSAVESTQKQIYAAKRKTAINNMLIGGFFSVAGIIATVADVGYIFWGAIVFGGIQFLLGLFNFITLR